MSRNHSCQISTGLVFILIISGCILESDDGTGQRVLPDVGVNATQVVYNPIGPGATHHSIKGESLPQLSQMPEDMLGLQQIRVGSEQVFEGKFRAEGLNPGAVRIQFFQKFSKGKIISQESVALLRQEGEYYTYSLNVNAPTTPGNQEAELQFIEHNFADPEQTIIHIIAKSPVQLIK